VRGIVNDQGIKYTEGKLVATEIRNDGYST